MSLNCPFCQPDVLSVRYRDELCFALRDAYPVSEGHSLIIPSRHIASFFETTEEERVALMSALEWARREIDQEFSPDGYNIGINDGPVAGQTVPHLHIHLIPRYTGDCTDPRGGVRWVMPGKARYWTY